MPAVEGLIENKWASVRRESGCNAAVVRSRFVPDQKLTGATSPVFLLDSTITYLPEAEIFVNTPYFMGFEEWNGSIELERRNVKQPDGRDELTVPKQPCGAAKERFSEAQGMLGDDERATVLLEK